MGSRQRFNEDLKLDETCNTPSTTGTLHNTTKIKQFDGGRPNNYRINNMRLPTLTFETPRLRPIITN